MRVRVRIPIKIPLLFATLLLLGSCAFVSSVLHRGDGLTAKSAQSISHGLILQRDEAATRGVALCTRNKLTTLQCNQLAVATEEARVASLKVVDLIEAWTIIGGRSSDKIKRFDEFAAAQRESVEKLVAMLPEKETTQKETQP